VLTSPQSLTGNGRHRRSSRQEPALPGNPA
jgi:hypothetical protein